MVPGPGKMIAAEKGAEACSLEKKKVFRGGVERSPSVPCSPTLKYCATVVLSARESKGTALFFSTVRFDPQVLGYSGIDCTDLAGI